MLKTVDTLTIKDYKMFERTNDPKYLCVKKAKYKQEDLDKLLEDIAKGLSGKNEFSSKMSKEDHKIKSMYRLQKLINYYQIMTALINHNNISKLFRAVGMKYQPVKSLEPYRTEIKEQTGIDVEDQSGLERLKNKIQWYSDKYVENFDKEKQEGLTFMQIVLGVFSALNQPLQYDMCLSDFFIQKETAEKIAKKWQTE